MRLPWTSTTPSSITSCVVSASRIVTMRAPTSAIRPCGLSAGTRKPRSIPASTGSGSSSGAPSRNANASFSSRVNSVGAVRPVQLRANRPTSAGTRPSASRPVAPAATSRPVPISTVLPGQGERRDVGVVALGERDPAPVGRDAELGRLRSPLRWVRTSSPVEVDALQHAGPSRRPDVREEHAIARGAEVRREAGARDALGSPPTTGTT